MKKILILLIFCGCSLPQKKEMTLSDSFDTLKKDIEKNAKDDNASEVKNSFDEIHRLIEAYPNDSLHTVALAFYAKKDSIVKVIEAKQEILIAKNKKEADKQAMAARKAYELLLRNQFLDNGLDIKVKVSGKNNENLKLNYILFSDVWARKFETEGFFTTWTTLGFESWALSDGHDYNMRWK